MLALALALSVAAKPPAPPPPPLPDIPAPLGHFEAVASPVPEGGVPDQTLVATFPGCPAQAIWLLRALSGTARAVEQLQLWLDASPGFEGRLFTGKQQLGEVIRQLTDARLVPKRACTAPALGDGYRLELASASPRLCPAPHGATTGDFWFFTKDAPAAVVEVQPGKTRACAPRLSVVLFDPKGQSRVRVHVDGAGAPVMLVLGDKSQCIEFTWDSQKQVFSPRAKSCKP
jgi:hypothetical protein